MSNLPVRQAVFLALIFLASPALAQDSLPYAMRAPLDIIPAPMRQAVGDNEGKARNAETKLAPRVAARQMTRAVRAVAALPGSETQIVQVGQLGALEDAPVGLEFGFGGALWQGARLNFVGDLMARLPKHHHLSALRQLERRLHRSATAAPIGSTQGTSWTVSRLNRFLAIGDTQSVLDLAVLTGIDARDALALKAKILAHLGQGDDAAACAQTSPQRQADNRRATRDFFLQLTIYCHLRDGDDAKAALAIELNEKILADDVLFRDLAFLLSTKAPIKVTSQSQLKAQNAVAEMAAEQSGEAAETREPVPASAEEQPVIILPAELTAMQIALLRLAGQALPVDDNIIPAYLLAAVAADERQTPLVRAQAAVRNLAHGQKAALRMTQLGQRIDFSEYFPAHSPARTSEMPLPIFIASSVQQIDRTPLNARPRVMAFYLRQALDKGVWRDMVWALSGQLNALTTVELIDAPTQAILLPALVMISASEAANRLYWMNSASMAPPSQRLFSLSQADFTLPDLPVLNLAETTSETLPEGESDDVRAEVAAPEDEVASPAQQQIEPASLDAGFAASSGTLMDWQAIDSGLAASAKPVSDYLRLEVSVLQGLGFQPSDDMATDFALDKPSARAQRWLKLASDKWIGDLILAITADMAEQPAAQWTRQDIIAVLMALRQAGLNQEAIALARELLALAYIDLLPSHSNALILANLAPTDVAATDFSLPQELRDETMETLIWEFEWSDNLPLIDFDALGRPEE
jgi:hypothetical protein